MLIIIIITIFIIQMLINMIQLKRKVNQKENLVVEMEITIITIITIIKTMNNCKKIRKKYK